MRNVVGFGTAQGKSDRRDEHAQPDKADETHQRQEWKAHDSSPRLHRPGELRRSRARRHQVRRVKGTTLDDFRNSARGGLPERWE